jgi:hypothetical protein
VTAACLGTVHTGSTDLCYRKQLFILPEKNNSLNNSNYVISTIEHHIIVQSRYVQVNK